MKKRIASIALSLAMCLTLLPTAAYAEDVSEGGAFDSQPSTGNGAAVYANEDTVDDTNEDNGVSLYSGGSGTVTDPWVISTVDDLQKLAETVNDGESYSGKYFIQDTDLDLMGITWEPIGYTDGGYYFSGHYDGKNHSISNATSTGKVDVDGQATVGIFGCIIEGSVSNLHVKNANFSVNGEGGYSLAGGIAGITFDSDITNCSVENSSLKGEKTLVANNACVGGITGYSVHGIFQNCASANNKIISQTYAGGIVGEIDDSISNNEGGSAFTNCYVAEGNISAFADDVQDYSIAGGFIGQVTADNPTLENCYVYDTLTSITDTKAYFKYTGVIVGNRYTNLPNYEAKITTNTCYYGECTVDADNVSDGNAGTAVEKTEVEFADGTVKGLLGEVFIQGEKYPVLASSPADYTKVDEAIAAAKAIDGSRYTNYADVEAAISAVDRNKSKLEQAEVDKMAKDIRDAIDALVKKSNSSSSGGGGGSSTPRYAVTVPDKTENGSLSVTPKNAKKGSDVTITATPDKGYEVDDIVAKDAKGNKLTLKDNGDGTYTFTMPASKVTVTVAFAEKKAEPIVPEKLFADVSAEEYYYEAVKWASENGVTGGIGENLFGANLPCTRAQIVTFLWRAAGSPEPKGMSGFVDVSADAYYVKAVAWAVEQGIVSGTSATTFSPDAVCTRAQSVAFLYRAFGEKVNKAAGFSDVSADAYYADAVAWAVENGVASGIGGGLFAPDQNCARGQIVAFLYRAYQNK
ncbi:S-layer homology domain-containing protein [Anaerotignum faecicola]